MAIAAVEKGTSIRGAAEMYGIPQATLHDHISGRVRGSKPGPTPYLTTEEEEELASFLIRCAKIGYPHTRQQVMATIQEIVNFKPQFHDVITNGWWERFKQRHSYLTLRTAIPLSYVRAMAQDQESLDRYYDLLESTLKENDIFNRPTNLFNCDETGMPLNPKPLKTVSERGAKHASYLTGNSKSQITVLACTSAAGYALPPFIIFDRKNLLLVGKFPVPHMACLPVGGWTWII